MKSAKDFAKAWGVNSQSAGKRLSGKFGNGKYKSEPVMKIGVVPLYSDEEFERLTGVKVKNKVDLTGRICPVEISKLAGIKTNSVFDWLKRNEMTDYVMDCGVRFYKKTDIDRLLKENPPRKGRSPGSKNSTVKKDAGNAPVPKNALDLDKLNDFTIFHHRVSTLNNGRWAVRRFGMRDGDCLKFVLDLISQGEDVLIRSN